MAETAAESWWIKVGVLYDKSGFKGVIGGMLDINKAAGAVYDAFKKVVDAGSDMYNTARYLNVSTGDLQKWQRAFAYVTDSAEGATDAISSLNFIYDKLRLGMDDKAAEFGARLGLSPEDYLSFDRMLTALNKSYNELFKSDYGAFKTLAEQLGLSKDAILVVTQSTKEFQNTLRRAESIPFIPEHQIKAARELKKQFTDLSLRWENFKAGIISTSLPSLERIFKRIESVLANPETTARLQQFFQELEKGFNELATDENIAKVIEGLATVSQGLIYAVKGTGWALGTAKSGYEQLGTGAAQAVTDVKGGDLKHYVNPLLDTAKYMLNPIGAAKESVTNIVQNFTIDGSRNSRDIANEVASATKATVDNGNANMRTVENARNRTVL